MNNNPSQPREYDAVFSGHAPPPLDGAVLGGLEGVKNRLKSTVAKERAAALIEALRYGEEGLDLLVEALQDSSKQVRRFAFRLLRQRGGLKGEQALLGYDPWLFFTTLEDWKTEEFNPKVGIADPVGTAYVVESKKVSSGNNFKLHQFYALLQDSQAKKLEALKCPIKDNYWNRRKDFYAFVNALVEAREQLPNLKALFIGDSEQYSSGKFKIYICNIHPLLKAYPKLEVLKLRGRIDDDNFLKAHPYLEILQIRSDVDGSVVQLKPLKHNYLKTLIIEASDISDSNLAQICNLDLPSLEYFELWLGRQVTAKAAIDGLNPVLSGQSCPNLVYLGLIGSENTNAIAKAVTEAPIIEQIRVLDLSGGTLSNAGALALLNCPAVNRLHTLNVSENRLPANMIQQLSQLNCRVIAESQFRDRYYSVWE